MIEAFLNAFRSKYRKKSYSKNWKHWVSQPDESRCVLCERMHGKIYAMTEFVHPGPPLHLFCRCMIKAMESITRGEATDLGRMGADYWLKTYHKLPKEYISKSEAIDRGWVAKKGNLNQIAPDAKIGGDVFCNIRGTLPDEPGRIWYEADINTSAGYRGPDRVVYSNDGIVFVSYDHYNSFIEIT